MHYEKTLRYSLFTLSTPHSFAALRLPECFSGLQMAVEKMQGISRLEQFVEELSEEERAKELKLEKKRQKRKNRRKNKCGFDISEQEAENKEKILNEVKILNSHSGDGL